VVNRMEGFGADRALALRAEPVPRLGSASIDHGYDAWVEALCAFYENDELPQKAANLRNGAPLDYLDRRAIDALRAAFKEIEA
jgi:hypothetical protein